MTYLGWGWLLPSSAELRAWPAGQAGGLNAAAGMSWGGVDQEVEVNFVSLAKLAALAMPALVRAADERQQAVAAETEAAVEEGVTTPAREGAAAAAAEDAAAAAAGGDAQAAPPTSQLPAAAAPGAAGAERSSYSNTEQPGAFGPSGASSGNAHPAGDGVDGSSGARAFQAAARASRVARSQVVVVASGAGLLPCAQCAVCSGAHHALVGFFDSLRLELAHKQLPVAVTTVVLGLVATEQALARGDVLVGAWAMGQPRAAAAAIVRAGAAGVEQAYWPPSQLLGLAAALRGFPGFRYALDRLNFLLSGG